MSTEPILPPVQAMHATLNKRGLPRPKGETPKQRWANHTRTLVLRDTRQTAVRAIATAAVIEMELGQLESNLAKLNSDAVTWPEHTEKPCPADQLISWITTQLSDARELLLTPQIENRPPAEAEWLDLRRYLEMLLELGGAAQVYIGSVLQPLLELLEREELLAAHPHAVPERVIYSLRRR